MRATESYAKTRWKQVANTSVSVGTSDVPVPEGRKTSNFRERTGRQEQTHCIGNASEAGFESPGEKSRSAHSVVMGVQTASDLAALT